jgi:hypothetical protein
LSKNAIFWKKQLFGDRDPERKSERKRENSKVSLYL